MYCGSVQHTFLFILFALLIGQGDGRWKKSNREMLQHDVKLFKKMTEKIKEELGAYYEEYSEDPFADYFFEEVDYFQSKINRNMKRKLNTNRRKDRHYFHVHNSNIDKKNEALYTEETLQDLKAPIKNATVTFINTRFEWPSFEDILTEMGKKYDWKNDRWLKVKIKNKITPINTKNNIEHIKHNFRYRIVKLNRTKSKRNIVVAVTAVR